MFTKTLSPKHDLKSESPKIQSVVKPRMCTVTPSPCYKSSKELETINKTVSIKLSDFPQSTKTQANKIYK